VRGPGPLPPSPETPHPHTSSIIPVPHKRSVLIPSLQRALCRPTQFGSCSYINAYVLHANTLLVKRFYLSVLKILLYASRSRMHCHRSIFWWTVIGCTLLEFFILHFSFDFYDFFLLCKTRSSFNIFIQDLNLKTYFNLFLAMNIAGVAGMALNYKQTNLNVLKYVL